MARTRPTPRRISSSTMYSSATDGCRTICTISASKKKQSHASRRWWVNRNFTRSRKAAASSCSPIEPELLRFIDYRLVDGKIPCAYLNLTVRVLNHCVLARFKGLLRPDLIKVRLVLLLKHRDLF